MDSNSQQELKRSVVSAPRRIKVNPALVKQAYPANGSFVRTLTKDSPKLGEQDDEGGFTTFRQKNVAVAELGAGRIQS